MRPHNGRMRGNHSLPHALAVGATVAAVAVILALVAGVARAEQGIASIVADLPWWKAIAVAGIVVVLVLGVIQIVEAAVFGVRAVLRIVVAAVILIAAAITSAFSHEAPTGWTYPLSCCWSPSNAPAGRPGDCAEIAASTVVEGPDGYRITLHGGDHPVVNSMVTITIPYGREQVSPDGAYHLCLSDAMTPRCFFAGARGS